VLIAGLTLCSIAYAIAGMVDSYWVFIAMYGVAGLGNTVFHPADYSLLSHHSPKERVSQVFAFHTFGGIAGSAIAPVTLLYMQSLFGWRGAFIGASIVGLIVVAALIAQPEPQSGTPHAAKAAAKAHTDLAGA
jgi:MFS family permease